MSSTESSNRKRARASSTSREESTTIAIRPRTSATVVMAVASSGFESLVDDTLDLVLQFVGKRSYRSYGGINKRCRMIFLSKNLPKETFFCGYAPLSMIKDEVSMVELKENDARYTYRLGKAVVEFNRYDILQWLLLEKNKRAIVKSFDIAAYYGLNTLKRLENLVGDDAFTTMKIYEDWHVCERAAWYGKLDVLNWLKSKGWFDPNRIGTGMRVAARKGNILILEWLMENGCHLDKNVFYGAAKGGHLNVLEFLKVKNCPLDLNLCVSGAARGGSLESIRWLIQHGFSIDDIDGRVIEEAARKGHLHVIKFFIENGFSINDIDNEVSYKAAEGGKLHVLKWLHENNCPFDKETFTKAARNGNIDNLQWLLEIHCPFDKRTFANAANNGNIDNLQWLLGNNFPWDKMCYSEAGNSNNLEVLDWLKEKGCPRGDSVLAVGNVSSEAKDWLSENGFTTVHLRRRMFVRKSAAFEGPWSSSWNIT